jgi:hypothetical protein
MDIKRGIINDGEVKEWNSMHGIRNHKLKI